MQAFFGTTAEVDESGLASNNVTVTNTGDTFNVFSSNTNFPKRISAYSLGLTMSSSQVASYNAAMVAFQTALGRA